LANNNNNNKANTNKLATNKNFAQTSGGNTEATDQTPTAITKSEPPSQRDISEDRPRGNCQLATTN